MRGGKRAGELRAAAHEIIGASGGLVEARSNDLRVQASSLGEAVEMADRHLGIKWRWGTSAAEPGLAGAMAGVPGRRGRCGEVDAAIRRNLVATPWI